VFCLIDDWLASQPQRLRQRGPQPRMAPVLGRLVADEIATGEPARAAGAVSAWPFAERARLMGLV
jgi:hypothetical protein